MIQSISQIIVEMKIKYQYNLLSGDVITEYLMNKLNNQCNNDYEL